MFSCLQILEAFLWFVLITLLNVTLIILTLSVSRLLNLLLRLVAFLLFLNPQCLASISRWITASSSWKRFCLFVCRALSSIMVICMRHGSDKTLQVGYANHFYRSAHKFEQICRHRLRRQNVGYSNFSQPQSHLSFCVLLQYLVERRRVVTQLGKLD